MRVYLRSRLTSDSEIPNRHSEATSPSSLQWGEKRRPSVKTFLLPQFCLQFDFLVNKKKKGNQSFTGKTEMPRCPFIVIDLFTVFGAGGSLFSLPNMKYRRRLKEKRRKGKKRGRYWHLKFNSTLSSRSMRQAWLVSSLSLFLFFSLGFWCHSRFTCLIKLTQRRAEPQSCVGKKSPKASFLS